VKESIDMALVKCDECGESVSSSASKCPHCGVGRGPGLGRRFFTVLAILGALYALYSVLSSALDWGRASQRTEEARRRYEQQQR
jgi:hypothetical protein